MKTSRAELKMRARRSLLGNYGTMILAAIILAGISWAVSTVSQIGVMGGGAAGQVMDSLRSGDFSAAGVNINFSMNIPSYMYVILGLLGLISSWIIVLFAVGMNRMSLCVVREGRTEISQMFWAFKNRPARIILLQLLVYVLEFVSMVPVIVLSMAIVVSTAVSGADPNYEQLLFLILFLTGYVILIMIVYILIALNYGLVYYYMADHRDEGVFASLGKVHEMMKGNRMRYLVLQLSFIGWNLLSMLTLGIGSLWIMPYIRCTFAGFYLDLLPQAETIPPQWDGRTQNPWDGSAGF